MPPDLGAFVQRARARGLALVDIRALLLAAGWKDRQVLEALCASEPDLPLPPQAGTSTPREVGFQLLAFTALYATAISGLSVVFAAVDLLLPEAEALPAWRQGHLSSIRAGLATLTVALPAGVLLWRRLLRERSLLPGAQRSAVHRWLVHLSVFVGAVTLAANAITLLYFLFEGELTARFLLKAAALFLVAGAGFWFFRRLGRDLEAAGTRSPAAADQPRATSAAS